MPFFSTKFDNHSPTHFLGCFGLFFVCNHFFPSLGLLTISAIVGSLGLLWEVADELNWYYHWDAPFLDIRGGDALDLVVDVAGVALAFLILSLPAIA